MTLHLDAEIRLNGAPFLSALTELAERAPELFNTLIELPHGLTELARFELVAGAAPGTDVLDFTLQPSDRLRDAVAALQAGDRERAVAKILGHPEPAP